MQAFYRRHGGKNFGERVPPEASPGGHGSGNGAETSNSHKNKPLIRALLFTLCNLGWVEPGLHPMSKSMKEAKSGTLQKRQEIRARRD